jgi:predicted AlkP superfamily pyrophosphatase or phosphodiesterase
MKPQVFVFYCLSFFVSISMVTAQDTIQKIIPNRFNRSDQVKKPYLILISADGFRFDLADKYQARNLQTLRSAGVEAKYLQPSFPSLTFPNHYSIVTGLYPSHHGIVDNSFYDRKKNAFYTLGNKKAVADSSWYKGTPLWVLAEKQGMMTASFYWVASEAAIQGTRPSYYYVYNEAIPIDRRIEILKEWLELPDSIRPHLITFYFPEVDHEEHRFGPDSRQTEKAVHFVDESVGKMVKVLDSLQLPINYIFLSDHGMASIDTTKGIELPKAVDSTKFFFNPGLALLHLYARDSALILPTYAALQKEASGYDVYLAGNTPARWHYRKEDDETGRIGDIILIPHLPRVFNVYHRHIPMGEHGFDPAITDMHASFYAWGPSFKNHLKIPGFENVEVYPIVASLLGLTVTSPIDGDYKIAKQILKPSVSDRYGKMKKTKKGSKGLPGY